LLPADFGKFVVREARTSLTVSNERYQKSNPGDVFMSSMT
jgi:hypothetical protein